MKLFQRILSSLSLVFLVMLLFLLFFQDKVSLPAALQSVGRMHPLLLHLPIGLLIISFILWIANRNIEKESFRKIFILVLQITVFTATLSALMGFFLSREGGYDEDILSKHKLLGVATAGLSFLLLWIYQSAPERNFLFGTLMTISLITLIVGSHFGASLTHGEGFVLQPIKGGENIEEEMITDSSSLFAAAIRPIFKSKCFSCHNERKAKGELIMTTEESLLKGGKNGPIWKSGDALNSHIIQNINLPEDDKKHMPPKGKPQLTNEETALLIAWIESGADLNKKLVEYPEDDTLRTLASKFIHLPKQEAEERSYPFAAASVSTIQKLNGPFCAVFPLSQNSPALQADFFVRERFDKKNLEELTKVKEQIVVLNLGNMPVADADMKTIYQFSNLEKLILNNSSITNTGLNELGKLKSLKSLSLSGTKVDKGISQYLTSADSLKEIFIWNTNISAEDAKALQTQFKKVKLNLGYVPDDNEILALTSPILKNEEFVLSSNEKIELKHAISGTVIRYTMDGTDPDSTSSPVYNDGIMTKGFVMIKARATKAGWYSSPVVAFSFFKKGFKPSRTEFINLPSEKYKGEGTTTLIDSKKGLAESFNDAAWLGFREKPFAALFYFDTTKQVSSISVSYNKSVQSYLLPPEQIEIWGGDDKEKLKLLKRSVPPPTSEKDKFVVRNEGIKIGLEPSTFKVYKIVVKNLSRLPQWHSGKGEKAWIFIDEIFFN